MNTRETPIDVTQGCILVNDAIVLAESADTALVEIDCKTKRPDLFATGADENGAPLVFLERGPETLYGGDSDAVTRVALREFAGWRIFASEASSYSVRVALWKQKKTKETNNG